MITTQKISVSLPIHLFDYLSANIPPRELSSYISEAVEHKVLNEKITSTVDNFLALKSKMPKFTKQTILHAIHQGRT
ncbi:MAG: hypothetical protein WAV40_04305 [Microgenomates group bacterium]